MSKFMDYDPDLSLLDYFFDEGLDSPNFERAFMESKVEELRVYNNNICNMVCKHCYYGFNTGEEVAPLLTVDEWKRVFDEAISIGIKNFHFVGKEPLATANQLQELVEHLKLRRSEGRSITWELVTNGILVPRYATLIKDLDFRRVVVSVDNVNEQELTIRPSAYPVISALEHLKEKSVPTHVYIDCHKNNKDKVGFIIDLLYRKYGVKNFYVRPVYPVGEAAKKDFEPFLLSPAEYNDVINQVAEVCQKYDDIHVDVQMWGRMFMDILETVESSWAMKYVDNYEEYGDEEFFDGRMSIIVDFFYTGYAYIATCTADGYILSIGLEAARRDYHNISPGRVFSKPLFELIAEGKRRVLNWLQKAENFDDPMEYIYHS